MRPEYTASYDFQVTQEEDDIFELSIDERHGIISLAIAMSREQLEELDKDIQIMLEPRRK